MEDFLQVKRVNSLARREKSCVVGSDYCMLDCGSVETILTSTDKSKTEPDLAPGKHRPLLNKAELTS